MTERSSKELAYTELRLQNHFRRNSSNFQYKVDLPLPQSYVLRPLSHWMHKGLLFYRWTGTSRHSKIFQRLIDLVTTSGLLKLLDSTYNGKHIYSSRRRCYDDKNHSYHGPCHSCFPHLSSVQHLLWARLCTRCFAAVIANPPGAPWGKCQHLHSTREEAEASGNIWIQVSWTWIQVPAIGSKAEGDLKLCPTSPSAPFSRQPDVRNPIYWASVLFWAYASHFKYIFKSLKNSA